MFEDHFVSIFRPLIPCGKSSFLAVLEGTFFYLLGKVRQRISQALTAILCPSLYLQVLFSSWQFEQNSLNLSACLKNSSLQFSGICWKPSLTCCFSVSLWGLKLFQGSGQKSSILRTEVWQLLGPIITYISFHFIFYLFVCLYDKLLLEWFWNWLLGV